MLGYHYESETQRRFRVYCSRVASTLGCYQQPFVSDPASQERRKRVAFNLNVGCMARARWVRVEVEVDTETVSQEDLTEEVRARLIRQLIRTADELEPRSVTDTRIADEMRRCNTAAARLRAGQSEEAQRKRWY